MIYILCGGWLVEGRGRLLFSKNNIPVSTKIASWEDFYKFPVRHEMWPRSTRLAKLVSVNWKCFQFKPFSTTKSLALNFEGWVQISQELKALKIAPKSLFKKGETWIVFWICVVINLRRDAPSPRCPWWRGDILELLKEQSVLYQADVIYFVSNYKKERF